VYLHVYVLIFVYACTHLFKDLIIWIFVIIQELRVLQNQVEHRPSEAKVSSMVEAIESQFRRQLGENVVSVYIHICTYIYMLIYINIYLHVHTCVCIYVYISHRVTIQKAARGECGTYQMYIYTCLYTHVFI
jgi:hypothetical protein